MNLNPAFTHEPVGALADIIGDFITFKRSQGLKYIIEENVLYRFSVFSQNYRIENKLVPQKLISAWFERRPEEKPNTHSSRCSCINRLFRYAMNFGYHVEITEIPKHRNVTYMPYIFTESEITRFFNACDTVGRYPGSFRHMIIPVVFRLLYCCGLRVSEATGLKIKDVDLANCVLTIREPKNGRDRYVPMSMSLAGIMQKFSILTCRAFPTGEEFFFSGKYNNHLSRHQVYHWFRRCLEKAAIPHCGKGIGPREHDLRHSFCVHSLKLLRLQGLDVYCFLPWLSAYVGHKSIRATQYYLRLTADIFPELIEQITKNCMYVIPELTKEQAHETN